MRLRQQVETCSEPNSEFRNDLRFDFLIETRWLPTQPHCFPRSFTFYVTRPLRSIPNSNFCLFLAGMADGVAIG
jgi:hypothetical protein